MTNLEEILRQWENIYGNSTGKERKAYLKGYSADTIGRAIEPVVSTMGPFTDGDIELLITSKVDLIKQNIEKSEMLDAEMANDNGYEPMFQYHFDYTLHIKALGHEATIKLFTKELKHFKPINPIEDLDFFDNLDKEVANVQRSLKCTDLALTKGSLSDIVDSFIKKHTTYSYIHEKLALEQSIREFILLTGSLKLLSWMTENKTALRSLMIMYASGKVGGVDLQDITEAARRRVIMDANTDDIKKFRHEPTLFDIIQFLDDPDVTDNLSHILTTHRKSRSQRIYRML